MSEFMNGAEVDLRKDEEKEKDYKVEEVLASSTFVEWPTKDPADWRKFPIFNQNGSGSCVAQTEAKEMGIMRWLKDGIYVHFSATDIYQRRANKPAAGMNAVDARNIIRKDGATLEVLTPSQELGDAAMDGADVEGYKRAVGEVFAVPNYLQLPSKDIEAVASTIQATGKGVMVWFYFTGAEWTDTPTVVDPNLDLVASTTLRHSVTAVDFTLINGVKHLIIEDSWGTGAGIGGQRCISQDFFKARNWYAGYLINFQFEEELIDQPRHTFNIDMSLGETNDEIVHLQNRLKAEGTFPKNIDSSGYYGSITAKAVQAYQLEYNVTTKDGPGYGRCGPKTRETLNA